MSTNALYFIPHTVGLEHLFKTLAVSAGTPAEVEKLSSMDPSSKNSNAWHVQLDDVRYDSGLVPGIFPNIITAYFPTITQQTRSLMLHLSYTEDPSGQMRHLLMPSSSDFWNALLLRTTLLFGGQLQPSDTYEDIHLHVQDYWCKKHMPNLFKKDTPDPNASFYLQQQMLLAIGPLHPAEIVCAALFSAYTSNPSIENFSKKSALLILESYKENQNIEYAQQRCIALAEKEFKSKANSSNPSDDLIFHAAAARVQFSEKIPLERLAFSENKDPHIVKHLLTKTLPESLGQEENSPFLQHLSHQLQIKSLSVKELQVILQVQYHAINTFFQLTEEASPLITHEPPKRRSKLMPS